MVFGALFPEEDESSRAGAGASGINAVNINAVFADFGEVGKIRRTKPFHPDDLQTPAVQALKRNLDRMGITEFAPKFYAMRSQRMYEAGIVTQGGLGFTEKGKEVIRKYYKERGYSPKAIEKKTIKSALKIDPERGERASLKYAVGYSLDARGMAQRKK